jgi:hypothetical protein
MCKRRDLHAIGQLAYLFEQQWTSDTAFGSFNLLDRHVRSRSALVSFHSSCLAQSCREQMSAALSYTQSEPVIGISNSCGGSMSGMQIHDFTHS